MKRIATFAIILALSAGAFAGTKAAAKDVFAKLKSLVGTWEGEASHGSAKFKTKVIYKLTGGGSSLVETQFPGEPHEMTTVYHLDGDDLVLTHYCAAGNQPSLKWKGGDDSKFSFDFYRGSNMKPTDHHMHALTIQLDGPDHVVSTWTSMADGKLGDQAKFDLKRVK